MKRRVRVCGCGHEAALHVDGKGPCSICGETNCPKVHKGYGGKRKKVVMLRPPASIGAPNFDPLRTAMAQVTAALVELLTPRVTMAEMSRVTAVRSRPEIDLGTRSGRALASKMFGAETGRTSSAAPNFSAPPRPEKKNGLGKGELAVLTAVAQGATDRSQLVTFTGYKTRSVTTYLSTLRQANLLDGFEVTTAGRKALGPDFKPLPTGSALLRYWLERLGSGEATVLTAIVRTYPDGSTRGGLVAATGYAPRSVTTYLSTLGRSRLVRRKDGRYVASSMLFDVPHVIAAGAP